MSGFGLKDKRPVLVGSCPAAELHPSRSAASSISIPDSPLDVPSQSPRANLSSQSDRL